MADQSVTNVVPATHSLGTLIDKLNAVITLVQTVVVTTSANSIGAATTGNVRVLGLISANQMHVGGNSSSGGLAGGTNGTPATLYINSNVVITGQANITGDVAVSGNVTIGNLVISGTSSIGTLNELNIGNSTVNVVSNSSLLQVRNPTSIANLAADSLLIGTSQINTSVGMESFKNFITESAELGRKIKSATQDDNESYKLLDSHPEKPDTWLSGGCLMLAHALHKHLPGSKMVDVHNKETDHTEHVVVQHGKHLYDADGATPIHKFIPGFKKNEGIKAELELTDHDPERAKRSNLPNDPKIVDQIHRHLKKHVS